MIHQGKTPGKSSVFFMPMIDIPPSDLSCVYTTLKFVSDHAARHGVQPILTFDQPLYWKALTIILTEPANSGVNKTILRLGGFHTVMSFLGSIGHLMQGLGLSEVLETVYACNAVVHIMTGKAVARAIRGHSLVYRAISSILIKEIFNAPFPEVNGNDAKPNVDENVKDLNLYGTGEDSSLCVIEQLGIVYDNLIDGKSDIDSVCNSDLLDDMNSKFSSEKKKMKTSKTAAVWLLYMEMVEILTSFIKAERIGDWDLHLQSLCRMLPYFAAAGHNLYLKSAYVYLQQMHKLEKTNKDVYDCFKAGLHIVRRTDRLWGGLSTDLMIEQVLMRSVKTSGGLTRGKGMTETQRTQWPLSLPSCAEISKAIQDFCGTTYHTSNQHKEAGESRIDRDISDTQEIISFLVERNPFTKDPVLRNIDTGVAADPTVNVDSAKDIGQTLSRVWLETM